MITPDFSERTYTGEVLKTKAQPADALKAILQLTQGPRTEIQIEERVGRVTVTHCFLSTDRDYHRFPRTVTLNDGKKIEIPRQVVVRGKQRQLYDVLIAQCQQHLVIAVPFHQLAEEFFVRVDRALAGTNTLYEKLNITSMVMRLGSLGAIEVNVKSPGEKVSVSLTRCHLAYADRDSASGSLKQVQMTGPNLGAAPEYKVLVAPVLKPRNTTTVTPVILGFALMENGVKKSSATTDRHGNFKIWVAPGIRRLTRIFGLLEAIEAMENVASTTSNVPILQSKAIRDTED